MSRALDAMRLMRDTIATGSWMAVRLLSLAVWLVAMAKLVPAADFGWLAGTLGIAAVCAMLVGAGIPYLFFADAHGSSPDALQARWCELLGSLIALGPILVLLAFFAILAWMPLPVPGPFVLALLAGEVLLVGLVQAAALLLHATRRFGAASGLPAMLTVGRAFAAGLALAMDTTLAGYLAIQIATTLAMSALLLVWAGRNGCHLARPRLPSWMTLRRASAFAAMAGSSLATSELDKPILGRIAGLATTGHYAFAYRICTAAAMPVTALSATLLPRWTRLVAVGDIHSLRRSFALMMALVASGGIAASALLMGLAYKLPLQALGVNEDVIILLRGLVWIIGPIGLHQLAGTALIAIGRPLLRAGCDIAGLGILAVLFAHSYAAQAIDGLAIACILAESMTACLMATGFVQALSGVHVVDAMGKEK